MNFCMVLTTCPDKKEAETLARSLVEEKLAACVQISAVDSFYSWKGASCHDPEFRLVIKTRSSLYKRLEQFIAGRHSYELPQVIRIPVEDGLKGYLDWIEAHT